MSDWQQKTWECQVCGTLSPNEKDHCISCGSLMGEKSPHIGKYCDYYELFHPNCGAGETAVCPKLPGCRKEKMDNEFANIRPPYENRKKKNDNGTQTQRDCFQEPYQPCRYSPLSFALRLANKRETG